MGKAPSGIFPLVFLKFRVQSFAFSWKSRSQRKKESVGRVLVVLKIRAEKEMVLFLPMWQLKMSPVDVTGESALCCYQTFSRLHFPPQCSISVFWMGEARFFNLLNIQRGCPWIFSTPRARVIFPPIQSLMCGGKKSIFGQKYFHSSF